MQKTNYLLIERMVREMQLRNYSERTIRSYTACVSKLQNFSGLPFEKITIQQFKDYLHRRIMVDGVSVSMINQAISAFKIMQADVLGRKWEPVRIKRPRREGKLPVVLTTGEVARMISHTRNIKHRALLALAYSSGLRREETRTLKPADIDSEGMRIHVVAGIKKEISFHTLRHCFATHLLEKGVNIRLIQQFMGHNSIKTTSVYLHLANISPGSIVSPLDEMNI